MVVVSPDLAWLHLRSLLCSMKIYELISPNILHFSYGGVSYKKSIFQQRYIFSNIHSNQFSPSLNIIYDKYFSILLHGVQQHFTHLLPKLLLDTLYVSSFLYLYINKVINFLNQHLVHFTQDIIFNRFLIASLFTLQVFQSNAFAGRFF